MGHRQRNAAGIPRGLDGKRNERMAAMLSAGQGVGKGITVNRAGQFEQDLGDGMKFDDRGRSTVRLGAGLSMTANSPRSITADVLPHHVTAVSQAVADVEADVAAKAEQSDLDAANVAIAEKPDRSEFPARSGRGFDLDADFLGTVPAATINDALADHESRVATLEALPAGLQRESGSFKLTGMTPKEVTSALFVTDLTLCSVSLTRTELGVAPGNHYLDIASSSDGTFYVVSDSVLDDGKIHWSVIA